MYNCTMYVSIVSSNFGGIIKCPRDNSPSLYDQDFRTMEKKLVFRSIPP